MGAPKTVNVNVRMTEEEINALDKLAKYLHAIGKIPQPTRSDAIRLCLRFTIGEILKAIEAERYGTA